MQITSKFDLDQTVFLMHENQVRFGTIEGIHFPNVYKNDKTKMEIEYRVADLRVKESKCFASKEELINSL